MARTSLRGCALALACAVAACRPAPPAPAGVAVGAVPAPRTSAPPVVEGSPAHVRVPPRSAFAVIARTVPPNGDALPLVEHLAGGGLVVASDLVVARADGPGGAWVVRTTHEGLEDAVLGSFFDASAFGALRWVQVADSDATFAVHERAAGSDVLRLGRVGWQKAHPRTRWFGAVHRADATLAFEDAPGKARRIVDLDGRGPMPNVPRSDCPEAMAGAPDGALFVVARPCGTTTDLRVFRYAPGSAQADSDVATLSSAACSPVVAARGDGDARVACGTEVHRWDGTAWSLETRFDDDEVATSLSFGDNDQWWAALAGAGKGRLAIQRRARGAWETVPLPAAPTEPLDEESFVGPSPDTGLVVRTARVPAAASSAPMRVVRVDATDPEEILLVATRDGEAMVLSTRDRGKDVLRLSSPAIARVQVARSARRPSAPPSGSCGSSKAFVVFKDGTTLDALRAAYVPPSAPGFVVATVENLRRPIFVGPGALEARRRLGAFAPRIVCGVAVVDDPP